jgi:hypothetical protein
MKSPVVQTVDGPTTTRYSEPVSPELALVDPALREAALERLADPDDTLARLVEAGRVRRAQATAPTARPNGDWSRGAGVAARRLAEDALVADPVELPTGPGTRRLRSVAVLVAMSVGLVVALLAAGRGAEIAQTTASAPSAVPSAPVTTEPVAPSPATGSTGPTASPTRGRSSARVAPQRFAWAPVEGASGYHVELYRSGRRIFAAETTRPALTVASSWTFRNRRYRLEPAAYTWYVWPIVSGRRTTQAVVQATLNLRQR